MLSVTRIVRNLANEYENAENNVMKLLRIVR